MIQIGAVTTYTHHILHRLRQLQNFELTALGCDNWPKLWNMRCRAETTCLANKMHFWYEKHMTKPRNTNAMQLRARYGKGTDLVLRFRTGMLGLGWDMPSIECRSGLKELVIHPYFFLSFLFAFLLTLSLFVPSLSPLFLSFLCPSLSLSLPPSLPVQ